MRPKAEKLFKHQMRKLAHAENVHECLLRIYNYFPFNMTTVAILGFLFGRANGGRFFIWGV